MHRLIPFTYLWYLEKMLNNDIKTVLDLGCGKGEFGDVFNRNGRFEITGVDIFNPYLEECSKKGLYKKVIKSDLRKIKFTDRTFDAVVCLQVVEHLDKKDAEKLIKKMESVAKKIIIISTPVGVCRQDAYDDNDHQAHLSSWYPKDFVRKNYKVKGVSLKMIYGSHSHAQQRLSYFQWIGAIFSYMLNPIMYFYPNLAAQMIAVKNV